MIAMSPENATAIPRDLFTWEVNELVSGVRGEMAADLQRITSPDGDTGVAVSDFDLAVQVMLNACFYPPNVVWQGDERVVNESAQLIAVGEATHANRLLLAGRCAGQIAVNRELMLTVAERQMSRLQGYYTRCYDGGLLLPNYNDPASTPFEAQAETVATSKRREYIDVDGERQAVIGEKNSGKRIVLKQTDALTSKAYAEGFHYIHEPRPDEVAAYGAYMEDDPLPFAWVTYSPIAQPYKREMMAELGYNPARILEMTRAWNAIWSPKNTMSLLFAHAHTEMQLRTRNGEESVVPDGELAGVLTAINPNLGFRANAFNGVDFGVVGLKPASCKYLVGSDGTPTYMLRRAIARELGVSVDELPGHPRFARNAMPLLPTNEMAVIFNRKTRHKPDGPIHIIDSKKYASTQTRVPVARHHCMGW